MFVLDTNIAKAWQGTSGLEASVHTGVSFSYTMPMCLLLGPKIPVSKKSVTLKEKKKKKKKRE